jgi:hypothetical protein
MIFKKNFKVRTHRWDNGDLQVNDVFFSTIEEAYSYVDTAEGEVHKIMNNFGQVVHERRKHHHNHIY